MKKALLLLSFFTCILISGKAFGQLFQWVKKAGSTGDDMVMSMCTDKNGNVYSLGYFSSATISFGTPATLTLTNAGGKDIYLLKQNCMGDPIWAVRIGGSGNEGGAFNNGGICYDSSSDVLYIAATFEGTCTFGTTFGTTSSLTSSGNSDGFIARYTTSGARQWATRIGGVGWDEATDILWESSTYIVVSGFFSGTCTFYSNTSGINGTSTSAGNTDGFVVRYSTSGQYLANTRAGGSAQDGIFKITRDKNGDLLTGIGTCCGGNIQVGSYSLPNAGNWGGVLAKLSFNFSTWQWAAYINGNGPDSYGHPIVDDNNNVYAMFSSSSSGTTLSSTAGGSFSFSPNNMDLIWAKFSPAGVLQQAQLITSPGYDQAYFGGKRTDGKMFVSGWFEDSITFGSGTLSKTLFSNGAKDAFVAVFNADGSFHTAISGGGAGDDLFTSVAATQTTLYAGGYYSGNATFGLHSLTSNGNADAVTTKILPQALTPIQDSITVSKLRLCNTDTATLRWVPNGNPATYRWLRNNSLIPGAVSASYIASLPGIYALITTRCELTDTSNSITLTADTVLAFAGYNVHVCRGDTAQIKANVSGTGTTYTWNTSAHLLQPDSLYTPVYTDSTRSFVLTATKGNCITRDTVQVTVETCCLSCQSETSINQGLVACYPFNGNAVDETGNGNDGIILQNATLVKLDTNRFSESQNSYRLNGNFPEQISVQTKSNLRKNFYNFSINTWVYVDAWKNWSLSIPKYAPILAYRKNTWRFSLNDSNRIELVISGPFSSFVKYVSKPISEIALGKWLNVGVASDSNYLFFHLDGKIVDSVRFYHSLNCSTDSVMTIGSGEYFFLPYHANICLLHGKIDDIRIYNRALTAAEVWQLYASTGSQFTPEKDTINNCQSDSIQLLARKSEFYQWSPSTALSKSDIRNPKAKSDSSYIYTVQLRNGRCAVTDTILVSIIPSHIDSVPDSAVCKGDSIVLTAHGGSQYLWIPAQGVSNPNSTNPKISPDSTTTYVVKITDGNCFRYDTSHVVVKPLPQVSIRSFLPDDTVHYVCWNNAFPERAVTNGNIVNWWPATFVSDTLADTVWVTLPQSGYIGVRVQSNNCFATDSVFVVVDTSAKGIGLGADITLCRGDSVLLKPVPNTNLSHGTITPVYKLTYLYPFNYDKAWASPDTTVKYILTGGSSFWCSVKDTIEITVVDKPNLNIVANDTVLCVGDSTLLSATGAQSYTWIKGENIFSPTDSVTGIRPLNSQYYTVRGIRNGCTTSDSVWLRINQLPLVFAGNDTAICYGDTLLLEASSPTATQFFWNNSNIPAAQLRVSPLFTSLYIVKASDNLCTSKEDSVRVTIHPKPSAAFALLPDRGEAPLPVRIIDQSTDVQFYQWLANDTIFSTLTNPTKVFFKPGAYQIKLLVTSDKGCVDTASKYLYVDSSSKPVFFIPNVITPDGDGLNDNFNIVCDLHIETSCTIRNRWGQIMYEKNMNFEPVNWNGRENGMECAEGVYYYFITIKIDGDRIKEYKGSLQLIK